MKLLLFHNIATSYYKNIVFDELYKIHKNFKIIHLAETEKIREWKIDLSELHYPYEVLAKGSMDDYSSVFYIKQVWLVLRKEQPDVVYFGGYFHVAYWIALIWAKVYGAKTILEMDSNRFDSERMVWKEFIKRKFVKLCDMGITYGKLSKSYFIELGMPSDRIVIKPNVSSSSLFFVSRELLKPHAMTFEKHFIYVGRFSKEKNLLMLLECFDAAMKNTNNIKWGLVLVGGGLQQQEIQDFIDKSSIRNIIFTGFVDKKDLKNYYNHANVFVLPSTREPWGLVANEAMMCGLPVIISKQCGCYLDLVKENGYIFDPYNRNELTSILERYMKNDELVGWQGRNSLEIIKKFTPELAASRIDDVLKLLKKAKN